MRSVLPRVFHPNRLFDGNLAAEGLRGFRAPEMAVLAQALQRGVLANLRALLASQAPVALTAQDVEALVRPPPARRRWRLRRAGKQPPVSVMQPGPEAVRLLLRKPQSLASVAVPGPDFGPEILLRVVLRQGFADPVFLHELGEVCRTFLCQHVLFHPGPPPHPDFSPAGLGLLIVSQPGHLFAPDAGHALLRAAVAELAGPCRPWDQWLLRLMGKAPGWAAPPDLAGLPWVVWTPEAGFDAAAAVAARLPAYWPSILDLAP